MPDQITIPGNLRDAVEEDDIAARSEWLARLPDTIIEIANDWGLKLGQPYLPGGQCAWVAPSVKERVLKVQWRHWEAEHEIDALRLWDGDGAIRCFSTRTLGDTTASLFERCVPGVSLKAHPPRSRAGRSGCRADAPPVGAPAAR